MAMASLRTCPFCPARPRRSFVALLSAYVVLTYYLLTNPTPTLIPTPALTLTLALTQGVQWVDEG